MPGQPGRRDVPQRLLKLWLRTLPDLGKTSLIEQLNHIERNHIMNAKHTPTVLLIAGLALALLSFSHFIMPFGGVFMLLVIGSSFAILAKAAVELFRPANELPAILIRTFILMFLYAMILPAWAKLKMQASISTPVSHDPFGLIIMVSLGANPVVAAIKLGQYFVHRFKS